MSNGGYLGESSTKAEIERRFLNAKHVMDALRLRTQTRQSVGHQDFLVHPVLSHNNCRN